MPNTAVPGLVVTEDNTFFFRAAREGRLEIQRCSGCGELRHPPTPCCPFCHDFASEGVEVAPRGIVHSFTVAHRPQDPGFSYPLPIALVDLDAGVRIVADVVDTPLEDIRIGMAVEVVFTEHPHGEVLPSVRGTGAGA